MKANFTLCWDVFENGQFSRKSCFSSNSLQEVIENIYQLNSACDDSDFFVNKVVSLVFNDFNFVMKPFRGFNSFTSSQICFLEQLYKRFYNID